MTFGLLSCSGTSIQFRADTLCDLCLKDLAKLEKSFKYVGMFLSTSLPFCKVSVVLFHKAGALVTNSAACFYDTLTDGVFKY